MVYTKGSYLAVGFVIHIETNPHTRIYIIRYISLKSDPLRKTAMKTFYFPAEEENMYKKKVGKCK